MPNLSQLNELHPAILKPPTTTGGQLSPLGALMAGLTGGYILNYFLQQRRAFQGYTLIGQVNPADEKFFWALESITGSQSSQGNRLQILVNGDQIFPSMLEAIRNARKSINFLTFVYWKGEIGEQFAEAIVERARAGVICNVLLDTLGAAPIERRLIERMRQSGATVVWFRPPNWYNLRKLNNRTHRKVLVVDGKIGFTGGVGIADEWTGNAQNPDHWRDTHVRVEGPAVRGLQGAFSENWLEATGSVLAGEAFLPLLKELPGGLPVQVTRSGAGKDDSDMATLFFLAIAAARKRLWLTTAYFAPRSAFVRALCAAARRGVDVRVLVPGAHADKRFVRSAGRANYTRLLKCGVRIYEYRPTMLHAKTMVVDSVWATIGSANFDNRSFALNDEVNISVHDPEMAVCLEQIFEEDLTLAQPILPRRWYNRPTWERVQEKAASLVKHQL